MDFHNFYHLGDSIYSLIFLNNIIENNDVDINFYIKNNYLNELEYHNYKNLKLLPRIKLVVNSGVDCWIQANNIWVEYYLKQRDNGNCNYYDEFLLYFNKDLANRNNLKHSFNKIEDVLYYHPDLDNRRYDDYDFFIINSRGLSGQYRYNNSDFVRLANKLISYGFKVITTEKIQGVDSTIEKGMTLKDIGNLSIGCKNVIAVHTAPITTALNKISINTVNKWILLNDKNITYKIVDMKVYDDVKKIEIGEF